MRLASCVAALLLATASCGSRSDGAAAIVSTDPVPVRWVVVGVTYSMPGNESWVWYGQPPSFPAVDADWGARWTGAVRAAAPGARVATLAPLDTQRLTAVTASSVALGAEGANGIGSGTDVVSRSNDWFEVWLNPAAVVTTDAAGERTIAWSSPDSAESCAVLPFPCFAGVPFVWGFTAGELEGTMPAVNPSHRALLDWLGPEDRAAILAHDPFFDPALDPSTLASDPRFEPLGEFALSDQVPPASSAASWSACSGAVTDADSPVLLEREIPFGTNETLAVQYSFYSPTATCETQRPGVVLGTSTPGCAMQGGVYVDRVFGTVLTVASSVTAACTR